VDAAKTIIRARTFLLCVTKKFIAIPFVIVSGSGLATAPKRFDMPSSEQDNVRGCAGQEPKLKS
jgi:hypothetical protein